MAFDQGRECQFRDDIAMSDEAVQKLPVRKTAARPRREECFNLPQNGRGAALVIGLSLKSDVAFDLTMRSRERIVPTFWRTLIQNVLDDLVTNVPVPAL